MEFQIKPCKKCYIVQIASEDNYRKWRHTCRQCERDYQTNPEILKRGAANKRKRYAEDPVLRKRACDRAAKTRTKLSDSYINKTLFYYTNTKFGIKISYNMVPSELTALKRKQLILFRNVKNQNNNSKNC